MDIVNPLLQAALETLIQVLLPIVLAAAGWWLREQIRQIRLKIDFEKMEFVRRLVREFVKSAEQSGLIGIIEDTGKAKLEMVMAMLDAELQRRGIKLDLDVLRALIEAAVWEEINQWKPVQGE